MRLRPVTILLAALLCAALLSPKPATAADEAPLAVTLNTEPHGSLIALIDASGDIALLPADLHTLGLQLPEQPQFASDSPDYVSLATIDGLNYHLNMATLTLELTADAALLRQATIDLESSDDEPLLRPVDNSAFVNYAIGVGSGVQDDETNLILSNELGIRRGHYLFLSNAQMTSDDVESRFVRLNTSLSHEKPGSFERLVVGDVFATTGDATGGVQLGGVQYSRNFRSDPYFKTHPGLNLSGSVAVPSEIEVLLDGHRVLKEKLSPGPYNLTNIRRFRGAGEVEIVVRDIYGREERSVAPFYLSDDLLRPGLHSYSYSAGALRELYGRESFNYGDFGLQAYHDYGWNEQLTFGAAAEAGSSLISLIPRAVWQPGSWGRLRGSLGLATGADGLGYTGSIGYQYFARSKGVQVELRYANDTFTTLATRDSLERPEFTLLANANLHSPQLGSLTIDSRYVTDHSLESQGRFGAIYSKRLSQKFSLVASLHATTGRDSEQRGFISLSYLFRPDTTLSVITEATTSGSHIDLQAEKQRPLGEGYSYKALLRQGSDETDGASTLFNPIFEYRGKYGIYQADVSTGTGQNSPFRYRVQAAGALTFLGGEYGLTRPVTDSFALIQVADLEGIPVRLNNQEVGTTNRDGRLFLAEVKSYYKNQISIDDRAVPINRALTTTRHLVAPPLRSGFCLYFSAPEVQPLIGRLAVRRGSELLPVEYKEFTLTTADGASVTIPTGRGGEFYYDPSTSGAESGQPAAITSCSGLAEKRRDVHTATELVAAIVYNGKSYRFAITVPKSEEFFADAGQVLINPDSGPAER